MNNPNSFSEKEIKPTKFYANKNRSTDFEDLRTLQAKSHIKSRRLFKIYFCQKLSVQNKKKDNNEEVEVDSLRFQDDYLARKYQTDFS